MTKKLFIISAMLLTAQSCSLNPFGGGGGPIGGILKSTDAGETWERAVALEGEGTLAGVSTAHVYVEKNDADNLLLTSPTNGVYISSNGAQNWKQVLSARIYDAASSGSRHELIVAGGQSGGVAKAFRSNDRGESWIEVFSESEPNTFVSAARFYPGNSEEVVIGLSTGELVLSRNGGLSWNLMSDLTGRILEIYISPSNRNLIYALSMTEGVYRSTDGGNAWEKATEGVKVSKYFGFEILESNENAMYVATDKGLYRTANAGANWQLLTLPSHEESNVVSAVTVNQNKVNEVYAAIGQTLYKSLDSGDTWQTRTLPSPESVRDIAVDPGQGNILYISQGQVLK